MTSVCSNPHCPDCANAKREWEKVDLAKKRLAIAEESAALEKELYKAERKKLKVNNKLAIKQEILRKENEWAERERAYQERIREFERTTQQQQQQTSPTSGYPQQEAQERKFQREGTTSAADGPSVDDLQTRLDELAFERKQELEECKASLAATQKALAELFMERDTLAKDRDRLAQQLQEQSCSNCSKSKEEIEGLERDLQQLKSVYSSTLALHASEKRKLEEQSVSGDVSVSLDGDEKMQELRDENQVLFERQQELMEELEAQRAYSERQVTLAETNERTLKEKEEQWETQRRLLQRQLEDQTAQIGNWKLLIPRNKILLEQERLKNEELEGDLEAALQRTNHLEVQLEDYQNAANELQKVQAQEIRQMKAENEKLLKDRVALVHAQTTMNGSSSSSSPSLSSNGNAGGGGGGGKHYMAMIPSDLQSSGSGQMAGESQGRHVAELDWEGKELSGKFTGWLNSDGNPDGHGTLRMEDESVFDGEWRRGEWNGHGVYTTVDGDLYRGTWKDGKQHGRGVYVWADGCIYTGDYIDGNRQGKGIMTWPYGAKYEGDFQFDRRNGRGIYNYPDGRCYSGQYRDDRRHGVGTETAADGTVLYSGNWVMGEFIDE